MKTVELQQLIDKQPDVRAFFRGAHIVVCRYIIDVSDDVFHYRVHGVVPEYVREYIKILRREK